MFFKSLIHFIFIAIFAVIISLSAIFLNIFLPYEKIQQIITYWAKFTIWSLQKIVGLNFKVIGKENIYQKPCVIVANHQSAWETIAFQVIFPRQTWILKKELILIPFFGWGLVLLKAIFIDRSNKIKALKNVIEKGILRLEKNISIVIFPEGTRNKENTIGNYQPSAVLLAKRASVKIQPVVHNAGLFWSKKNITKKRGTITVIVGKPIEVANDAKINEVIKEIKNWTEKEYQKIS